MAIPLLTGRRRPRSDVDHALDVGALAREHAFDLTLRRGSRLDGAWIGEDPAEQRISDRAERVRLEQSRRRKSGTWTEIAPRSLGSPSCDS